MKNLDARTEGLKYPFSCKSLRTENMLCALYDWETNTDPHWRQSQSKNTNKTNHRVVWWYTTILQINQFKNTFTPALCWTEITQVDMIIVTVSRFGLRDYYKSHFRSLARFFVCCFLPAYFLNTAWKTSVSKL